MLWFNYLSAILDPLAMDEAMKNAMLNCDLNVCVNGFMSMFEKCPNNELLELLKTKKHVGMFVHMLKYFENENHILHNSLCESNSLIKKYKRRNRILCDKVENLRKKFIIARALKTSFCLRSRVFVSCLLVWAHFFESFQFMFMVS